MQLFANLQRQKIRMSQIVWSTLGSLVAALPSGLSFRWLEKIFARSEGQLAPAGTTDGIVTLPEMQRQLQV